jgi:uncharacterized protein YkwD
MRLRPRFLLSLALGGTLLAFSNPPLVARAEDAPAAPSAPAAPKTDAPAPKTEAPAPKQETPVKPQTPAAGPQVTAPVQAPAPVQTPAPAAAPAPQPIVPPAPQEPKPKAEVVTPAPQVAHPKTEQPSSVVPTEEPVAPPTAEELQFLELCNQERAAKGLNRLTLDLTLTRVAREHSSEMRDKSYFNHESPTVTLKTPLDRYLHACSHRPGYACVGENLFWATIVDVKRGHKAFMDSPTHRENILFPRYERMGVGIVKRNGEFWVTEMFVTNTDPVSVAKNKIR